MRDPKSERKAPVAAGTAMRLRIAGGAALVVIVGVLGFLIFRGRSRPAERTSRPEPSAVPTAQLQQPRLAPFPIASVGPRGKPRRKASYEKMLETYLESTHYPPASRPLSELTTYRTPEAPPPAMRSSEGVGGHNVEQREHQNMYYVAEGESAIVTVELKVDGKPVTDSEPGGASLSKLEGTPRVASASIASTSFKDDGVAPDEHAKDGILTALVPFPKEAIGKFVGDMTLNAILKAGDAPLTTTFGFLYTGHSPARFTGQVREALEDGSLALYMPIEVEEPADYTVRARLYDSDGNAMVVMMADAQLETGRTELRFLAFGKLLRDLGAKSPYSLRDAEAYVTRADAYPDRLKVPTWAGPYVTRRYAAGDFSDKDWTSPEKQKRVEEIQRLIEATPE